MKKLLLSICLVFIAALAFSSFALAQTEARYWTVELSAPQAIQNSRTFNLDYVVSSTVEDDDFTVDLYQNGAPLVSEALAVPDSGRFEVTVPSDGPYSFYIEVTNNDDTDGDQTEQSATVSTQVVTTIPDSVIYSGKTVSGSAVAVNFTVPAGSSIKTVNIYGSTATSFALDSSTLLASVVATPGVAQVANFVNSLATSLNIAVAGFDVAGNQSAPTGDSNVRFSGNTASTNTSQGGALGGETLTETSSSTAEGETLTEVGGTTAEGQGLAGWKIALIAITAVIVAGAGGWYAYYRVKLNKEDN
jgi:hypothetical protein